MYRGGTDKGKAKSLGASTACTKACSGDGSTTCGGAGANALYSFPIVAGGDYSNMGCYKDDSSRKVPTFLDGTSMTVGKCANLARSRGFTLFSLQVGNECFGGTDMGRAKSLGTSTACTANCSGDKTTTCGGAWANQVYSLN